MVAHQELLAKAAKGGIDVYFLGDSIVRRWGALDYPDLLANWTQNFFGWNAANFGWGADRIEHILWRLEQGELDGVHPRVVVIRPGTNNVRGPRRAEPDSPGRNRGAAAAPRQRDVAAPIGSGSATAGAFFGVHSTSRPSRGTCNVTGVAGRGTDFFGLA
jgi:hypothetical protein